MNRSFRSIALLVVAAIVPALVLGVFIGALAAADKGHATIPAAIVNQDRFVQSKGANGKTTTIAAGRLVVTNLTKPTASGPGATIDWRLSNASQANDLLASGAVYAIVTIPKDFSKSISTVSTTHPDRASITIRTDDAHGYIVSQLASSLGTSLTATLGSTISEGVIKGLYGGYGTLHDQLGKAADGADTLGSAGGSLAIGLGRLASGQDGIASGATGLGSGAAQLASGADSLASGASSLAAGLASAANGADASASGASKLAGGVRRYTGGVSSLASGLRTAASRSSGLQQLPDGVKAYTGGVSSANDGLKQVLADPTLPAQDRAALTQIQQGLQARSDQGAGLVTGAQGAASLQSGVAASAAGAGTLAAGGPALNSGTSSLASGLGSLASGLHRSASGASGLASGAAQLASGTRGIASGADRLGSGAAKIASGIRSSETGAAKIGSGTTSLAGGLHKAVDGLPDTTPTQAARIADVVANPVQATSQRQHLTSSIGQIVAALILPVSLWIGASAAVLLFGAIRRRLLATGIGSGRLVGAALARGALLAVAQAVLLLVLLQSTLGLTWDRAALALLVAVVTGVAFFAVHQLLTALFGRAGTVISIVLLGAQLVAVGGLYPIQLVSEPFQVVSPYLPLTAAVGAMQAVITGADGGAVGGGIATLLVYGVVAFALTVVAVARRRSSVALFAPPAVPALG
ncbi:MAG: YhgE/Pip family protein [Amnibacterium sp.]